ncbi:MAG: VOC family protein, partial [Acidimicrobiia bacterium]|nr:VOC family protein [Acidimicrobiia bacterium]
MSTNLMVIDVAEALHFYRDVIGGEIAFVVDTDQQTTMDGTIPDNAAFASVRVGDNELMLQERLSLAADAPMVTPDSEPGGTFTLYFRVDDVDAIVSRLPKGTEVLKPLQKTWYGMK